MPKNDMFESFNQIILDNIPVSIITIDKDGFITSANKYFENFAETKDFRGVNIFTSDFFLREKLTEEYRRLLTHGGIFRKENVHEINRKGEDKYLSITAVSFNDDKGQIAGVVSLAADNTEAVIFKNKLVELNSTMEQEVKNKTRDLDKANKELSKALELKSIFIADVSHEFRTSLAIMQSSLELLANSQKNEVPDAELYGNISTEIKRVSSALNSLSLLNTSKPNSKLLFKKFNLTASIALVCNELKVVAEEKNIKIEYKDSKNKIEINGNKEDVEKLLLNLIRNAITYNKKNGWVKVWTEQLPEGVIIKVQDSGIGIAEEEFSNIFERFYRIDRARTRNKNDSGLGLAICRHVAEAHGGSITVESKLGEGSTFSVYLPASPRG